MKVVRESANFACGSRPFHNLAPRHEKAFWPFIVFRSGILRSVPDKCKISSLVVEHSKGSFLKSSGASEFKNFYVNMVVSFLTRSLIFYQPRS